MKVYLGQTRSRSLIRRLADLGFGEVCCPNELPPRRRPWLYDNGAFAAWQRGEAFNEIAFLRGFERFHNDDPEFIVAPDIVAGGRSSLDLSVAWRHRLHVVGPLYLAVQDGMTAEDVRAAMTEFDGLFVGGTVRWKLRTGSDWVALAHALHKPCHIGRVGTMRRVLWARRIDADSIDSALPLRAERNLQPFLEAISCRMNMELFLPAPTPAFAPPTGDTAKGHELFEPTDSARVGAGGDS